MGYIGFIQGHMGDYTGIIWGLFGLNMNPAYNNTHARECCALQCYMRPVQPPYITQRVQVSNN